MFYPNTKKRISISKGGKQEKEQNKTSIQNPSKNYVEFIKNAKSVCDKAITNELTSDEKAKVLWLKSRIDTQL